MTPRTNDLGIWREERSWRAAFVGRTEYKKKEENTKREKEKERDKRRAKEAGQVVLAAGIARIGRRGWPALALLDQGRARGTRWTGSPQVPPGGGEGQEVHYGRGPPCTAADAWAPTMCKVSPQREMMDGWWAAQSGGRRGRRGYPVTMTHCSTGHGSHGAMLLGTTRSNQYST